MAARSQASLRRRLQSSQEAQHRQAVLVRKLQAKVRSGGACPGGSCPGPGRGARAARAALRGDWAAESSGGEGAAPTGPSPALPRAGRRRARSSGEAPGEAPGAAPLRPARPGPARPGALGASPCRCQPPEPLVRSLPPLTELCRLACERLGLAALAGGCPRGRSRAGGGGFGRPRAEAGSSGLVGPGRRSGGSEEGARAGRRVGAGRALPGPVPGGGQGAAVRSSCFSCPCWSFSPLEVLIWGPWWP